MKTIGNILWIIIFGWEGALMWFLTGILWCITIVGIPVGKQCFKFASVSFLPFKKEVVFGSSTKSFLVNLLWIIFGGLEMAIVNALAGLVCYITIIGIPFGKQFFKLAHLSLTPFGAKVVKE